MFELFSNKMMACVASIVVVLGLGNIQKFTLLFMMAMSPPYSVLLSVLCTLQCGIFNLSSGLRKVS